MKTGLAAFPVAAVGSATSVPGPTQPGPVLPRIEALTSLRFFAAALIVLHHGREEFGFGQDWPPMVLGQGVSFFFVLSGFILCYTYPRLDGPRPTFDFLRARAARIWPAHLTTLLLAVVLLSMPLSSDLLVNAAMVHSLVPLQRVYYAYNAPSWSISTEFVFYLLFPLLILNFSNSWWWKLGLSLLGVAALGVAAGSLGVTALRGEGLTVTWFMYINPLARLAEFVLGMVLCHFWLRWGRFQQWSVRAATALEIAALAMSVMGIVFTPAILPLFLTPLGYPATVWLATSGSLVWFGFLIVVVASQRGWTARLLRIPWLVFLGEISYSVYLLHRILFRFYSANKVAYAGLPVWAAFVLFFGLTIAGSYGLWSLVEKPARTWLRGKGTMRPAATDQANRPLTRSRVRLPALVLAGAAGLLLVPGARVVERFAQLPPAGSVEPGGGCSIEIVEVVNWIGQPAQPGRGYLRLTGWAAEPENGKIPPEVYVGLSTAGGDRLYARARRLGSLMPRRDVGEALSNQGLSLSGWSLVVNTGALAPGTYHLEILQGEREAFLVCQTSTTLVVTPPGG